MRAYISGQNQKMSSLRTKSTLKGAQIEPGAFILE